MKYDLYYHQKGKYKMKQFLHRHLKNFFKGAFWNDSSLKYWVFVEKNLFSTFKSFY